MALRLLDGNQQDRLAEHFSVFEMALVDGSASIARPDDDLLSACRLVFSQEYRTGFDISRDDHGATVKLAEDEPTTIVEIDVEVGIWTKLSSLAHKSYVPASEASRLSGAGAGLTDND